MKTFSIAIVIVCATLVAGLFYGLKLQAAVVATPVITTAQNDCPDTLKSVIGIEDKPTVCR